MLLAILIGQRTPGHSTAEALAFETRIHQAYVDFIGRAGWDYLGVFDVEGLVPGAFGEILPVDAADIAEAFRRDAENEKDLPEEIATFYRECRALFWTRGGIKLWVQPPPGMRLPVRGEAVRITFNEAVGADVMGALPWSGEGEAPVSTVRLTLLGQEPAVAASLDLLPNDVARLPAAFEPGESIVFHPFVPAPERSMTPETRAPRPRAAPLVQGRTRGGRG